MKLKLLIYSSFIFFFTIVLSAQIINHQYFKENVEVYFSFEMNENIDLSLLTDIISIDNISEGKVFAYANETEYSNFLNLGIEHQILQSPGTLINPAMSNQINKIMDWDTYPTYEAYVSMMNQFAIDYPQICKLVDAGNTVQGRKILFVKISDNVTVREPEPQFLYTSSMHGDEVTGYILMLRLIDSLLTSYGTDTRITNLIDNVEIWINPLANPDGTYHGGNNTVYGATRYNANGYDLNRNFPDPENGIHPNEQQETSVFRGMAEQNKFVLSANFHGGAEVVNYPWDTWTNGYPDYISHPDESWYEFISHLYADTAQANSPATYMNGFNDGITNGGTWYTIHGGRQDYVNYFMHSREVTIEISDTKLLPGSQLPNHWEYNKRSFLDYIENTLYGVSGVLTDTSGNPLLATITVLNHDAMNSEVLSDSITGNYHRMLAEGVYSFLFAAEGFISQTINGIIVTNFNATILNVQLVPESIVPVELVSFSGKQSGDKIILLWSTATERNNSGFEVERKSNINLVNDPGNWKTIGFVKGSGSATELHQYSFTDYYLADDTYNYRLKQIDFNGSFTYSNQIEIKINRINEFTLFQNYPNPFNPATKIKFNIPQNKYGKKQNVNLKVYDVLGNEIATLIDEEKSAGSYEIEFNAAKLSSGIYYYRLQAGELMETKQMLLIK